MKYRKILLFALLLSIIATSCITTSDVVNRSFIQKRKYNKGFFVKKNKDIKNKDAETVYVAQKVTVNSDKIIQEITKVDTKTKQEIINNDKELIVSTEKKTYTRPNKTIPKYLSGSNYIKASKVLRKININPNDDEETKMHWAAVTSFVLGILLVPLLPIIFSAIALIDIKHYPENYFSSSKFLATLGLILGVIEMLVLIMLVFIILLMITL